jgi:hypothetical protein
MGLTTKMRTVTVGLLRALHIAVGLHREQYLGLTTTFENGGCGPSQRIIL